MAKAKFNPAKMRIRAPKSRYVEPKPRPVKRPSLPPGWPPPARDSFIALEANDGHVFARLSAIDAISNPVSRPGGNVDGRTDWALYLTMSNGLKTLILDTPTNRATLGIPSRADTSKAPPAAATLAAEPAPAGTDDDDEDDE
jgi:hypothetical protein